MEKVLITGASGFIGGFLVEESIRLGFETYAAIRPSSKRKYLSDPRIRFTEIDFTQPEKLRKTLTEHRFDYIIHNAGLTKASSEEAYNEVNCGYLQLLVNILQEENIAPRRFVFVSSLAAFGPNEYQGGKIIDNESTPHPVTRYGRSKLRAEQFLVQQSGFPYVIIRPTAVYGPHDKDFTSVYRAIECGVELYLGKKPQRLTFIYVKDLANAIFKSFHVPTQSAHFISDGRDYSLQELNAIIKSVLKKKTFKLVIPVKTARGLAWINEWVAPVFGRYPIFNQDKVSELTASGWLCDTHSFQKVSGFKPSYTLQEGLSETLDWYRANAK